MDYFSSPARRVYLYWAVAILVGFVATYFYQAEQINYLWAVLTLVGLVYMFTQMWSRGRIFRSIFLVWLVVLLVGMAMSAAVFYIPDVASWVNYLGVVWLILMAIGHAATGFFIRKRIYLWTTLIQLGAGAVCLLVPGMLDYQYLIAAGAGSFAMLLLLL